MLQLGEFVVFVREVEANLGDDGTVANGAGNQAATQGAIGQGLLWASQITNVDQTSLAESVLDRLLNLYNEDPGVFSTGSGSTHTVTARDAGDITGGLNALGAVLDRDVRSEYAAFFNQTFNRG